MGQKIPTTGTSVQVSGLNRESKNPCTVLHHTHTGRIAVRDQFGNKFRVDSDKVSQQ